jgi:hypothetical protein
MTKTSRYTNYHSPDGPARVVPKASGCPKFGEPSGFQVTFFAEVYLFPSQFPVWIQVAW